MRISTAWMRRLQTSTQPLSAPGSNGNAAKRLSARLLILAGVLLTAGCHSPMAIQENRMPEKLDGGGWRVTDGFLQDRYQIERTLRGQLERCEATQDAMQGADRP